MKQSLSPAAIAAIVVVVCLAIGYFGFRILTGGGANSGGAKPVGATAQYQQHYQNYGSQRMGNSHHQAPPGSGGPNGGRTGY